MMEQQNGGEVSIMQTITGTAAGLLDTIAPVADKVRHSADDLVDMLGTEGRHLGEMAVERVGNQLEQLPEKTLKRLNLTTRRKSRRNMLLAALGGMIVGAIVMKVVSDANKPAPSTHRSESRVGWNEPQTPAAVTGDLPQ